MPTKKKTILVPEQYQNNGSHCLLVTKDELRTISEAIIHFEGLTASDDPLLKWALDVHWGNAKIAAASVIL